MNRVLCDNHLSHAAVCVIEVAQTKKVPELVTVDSVVESRYLVDVDKCSVEVVTAKRAGWVGVADTACVVTVVRHDAERDGSIRAAAVARRRPVVLVSEAEVAANRATVRSPMRGVRTPPATKRVMDLGRLGWANLITECEEDRGLASASVPVKTTVISMRCASRFLDRYETHGQKGENHPEP